MDDLNPSTPRPAVLQPIQSLAGAQITQITPPDPYLALRYQHLVGQQYEFGDGVKIGVAAVKQRSQGVFVTYEAIYTAALPRRFTVSLDEFIGQFGHLFGLNTAPNGIKAP
jgi:hypothetical protein